YDNIYYRTFDDWMEACRMGTPNEIVRGFASWRRAFASAATATRGHAESAVARCLACLRAVETLPFASVPIVPIAPIGPRVTESLCRFEMAPRKMKRFPPMRARHPAPAKNEFLISQVLEKSHFHFRPPSFHSITSRASARPWPHRPRRRGRDPQEARPC